MSVIRLWFRLNRRKITGGIMVVLFMLGLVCISLASHEIARFYGAPVYSFKAGYSGFGIAHNDSIIPVSMTVGLAVNPSELWFDYYFVCYANGTYNFIFAFPFYITRQYSASEKMSTRSTPHGSAVWLQYMADNVSSLGLGHQIFGDFYIENTFQEGTKGLYTIILPFGMGIDFDVTLDLWQSLKVPFYSGDVNVTLYVALPVGFKPSTTFPPNRGLEYPPSHSNVTQVQPSLTWDVGTLQNSVTIEAVDTEEKSSYDIIPFTSGILFAVGLQFTFTIGYDSIRKWANSKEEEG